MGLFKQHNDKLKEINQLIADYRKAYPKDKRTDQQIRIAAINTLVKTTK